MWTCLCLLVNGQGLKMGIDLLKRAWLRVFDKSILMSDTRLSVVFGWKIRDRSFEVYCVAESLVN